MRTKILTIFFILLITSQVYGLALAPKTSLEEKRKFAGMPEFKAGKLLKSSYYRQLGKFLDDRYPYRSPFIVTKNWIDYHVFNTSPSPRVHIGRDGWFYLKRGMINYFKDDCSESARARNLARELNLIEKYLDSLGKRFFFVVAPNKTTIYPEFVGIKRSPHSCGKSFYDLFLTALKDYPLRGFIRLDQMLSEAKKDRQLYYKKGTHWNDRGAVLASRRILQRLSTPDVKYELPDIRYKEVYRRQDLAAMFALDLKERSDVAKIKDKSFKVTTERLPPLLMSGNFLMRITTEADKDHPLLPRTIIYRDSFMTQPLKIINGSFEEIDAIWTRTIPLDPEIDYNALGAAGIVIIEVIERNLNKVQFNERALLRATRSRPGY